MHGRLPALFTVIITTMLSTQPGYGSEQDIIRMLGEDRPYHAVNLEQFERLGWDLPDGGATVKALVDAAPGSAFGTVNQSRSISSRTSLPRR